MKTNSVRSVISYWWNAAKLRRKKLLASLLSSKHWLIQVGGYVFYQLLFFVPLAVAGALWCFIDKESFAKAWYWLAEVMQCKTVLFIISTLLLAEVIRVVRKLTPIFSIRRQEIRITVSQICILFAIGAWLMSILFILRLDDGINLDDKKYVLLFGAIGTLLAWIFQDTIRSVVAFLYVRLNGMINIGDWIKIDSRNIDGTVKSITLTMVTIENWDTTETSFPTCILHSDSFTNLQSMLDGKTHGRRMLMTFTIDSGWIQPITMDEAVEISEKLDACDYFRKSEFVNAVREAAKKKKPVLNIHLFRLYIFHWLMNHKKVCRRPRLLVRYMEPTDNGLPMQVYAYLSDISLEPFEWTKAGITEHILESMKWFNLRLYQNASAFDVSNSNIYLAPETAKYKNEKDETSE